MSDIQVKKIVASDAMQAAAKIRYAVFVIEQHCPPALEQENDEVSVHFLATIDGQPAGAARWRQTANGYKLERFAVAKEFRKRGVGSALVRAVLDDLPQDGSRKYLNAQLEAVPLYSRFDFISVGEEFVEANIRHQQMEKY